MLMEKETTGIYISGHPMDDYAQQLKRTKVIPIGALMEEDSQYEDNQTVTIAGVVSSVKVKTTRNNTMMAYVVLEDNTAGVEMLVFSKVLNEFGSLLQENKLAVVIGRVSIREDKEPQVVVNRVCSIDQYCGETIQRTDDSSTLYLRLPTEEGKLFSKIRAILSMFPGNNKTVLYFEDTKVQRGTRCALDSIMLRELQSVLGKENVVVK